MNLNSESKQTDHVWYEKLRDVWMHKAIDEFEFVPHGEEIQVVEDTKLGIHFSIVPQVFEHAKDLLLQRKDLAFCSLMLIMINGNHQTGWNERKRCIMKGLLSAEDDLVLTKSLLIKHPKSATGWTHRKWLLEHCQGWSTTTLMERVSEEIVLIERSAGTYPNNYYAWCHRRWVLTFVEKYLAGNKENILFFIEHEIEAMKSWTQMHIQDHSGLDYVTFLVRRARQYDELLQVGDETIVKIYELCKRYPEQEALWTVCSSFVSDERCVSKAKILRNIEEQFLVECHTATKTNVFKAYQRFQDQLKAQVELSSQND